MGHDRETNPGVDTAIVPVSQVRSRAPEDSEAYPETRSKEASGRTTPSPSPPPRSHSPVLGLRWELHTQPGARCPSEGDPGVDRV